MRTVITGGLGFIGSALVKNILKHVTEEDEIVVIDNIQRHGLTDDNRKLIEDTHIRFFNLDLCNREELDRLVFPVDRLYHLAAVIGVARVTKSPADTLRSNTVSTMNIFEWFLNNQATGARLIFSSSSEVYSEGVKYLSNCPVPTPENVPFLFKSIENPRFSYSLSKMWGEAFVSYLNTQYGSSMGSVRYHNVYGPDMGYDHVIPQIIERIQTAESPFKLIGGDQKRSFCWVEDAVAATILVMESEQFEPGLTVHIGDPGGEVRIDSLYEKLFKICNFQPAFTAVEKAPPGSVERRCPDIRLLEKITHFSPQTDLDYGLKKTAEWYLSHPRKIS